MDPNYSSLSDVVERIVAIAGPKIVAALPLGLGKPNELINALTARVTSDASLFLTIVTALSLDVPSVARAKPGEINLEAAFAGPFIERQFGTNYPVLDYVRQQKNHTLCERIRVHEFYFQSGSMLKNDRAQRDYISLNYTHVARELLALGVNVILHLVARRGDKLSLSCNPDVTLDALDAFAAAGQNRPLMVCAVHPNLPFLGNDAEVDLSFADLLLEASAHVLFALPREPVAPHEFAIGLHASALVKDGGTLQIGIGALSDALVYALIQRQDNNADYRRALAAVRSVPISAALTKQGGESEFERGLYGASEMVMDGFMHLRQAKILKRRVFDDVKLQTLLNQGILEERADQLTLARLIEAEIIATAFDQPSLDWLIRFGWLAQDCRLHDGVLQFSDSSQGGADLLDANNRAALTRQMQGRTLRGGRYLHGAFYLGAKPLYQWLNTLSSDDFEGLCMTRVSFINELYGGREALDRAQRSEARFFNTCMMQTLGGAAVSDGLADARVVSGVGGQYNFVAMAHAIPNGRSVLMLRSVREGKHPEKARSNIVWNYAHCTIPRHLRDIVISEYGVADLRGQSDEEVVKRLLAITDARFQSELIQHAKAEGKLRADFTAPDHWQHNTPARLAAALAPFQAAGQFARYPFGSDFDACELKLLSALARLKAATARRFGTILTALSSLVSAPPKSEHHTLLARVGLSLAQSFKARLTAKMLARFFD